MPEINTEKQKILKELYYEYKKNFDEIIQKYGEKDGFIINGEIWWLAYKKLIDDIVNKSKNNTLTKDEALNFYKNFGFSPKFYSRSFIESGVDKIKKLFIFLADPNIDGIEKIKEIIENENSQYAIHGIGINFITLFLTVCFPDKYSQWNRQIDEALVNLGLYPERIRKERKSDIYSKINNILIEISKILNVKNLPEIDNLLYCYNMGYIKIKETKKIKEIKKKIGKEIKDRELISELDLASKQKHLEIQYYLAKIGIKKGYDVWVAQNDRNKEYNNERLSVFTIKDIPMFTQPMTVEIAKFIDVIWFKKGTVQPVNFFEIEHSTSIYSGLLRLNDIKIDYPIPKATIIIPKERKDLLEKQLARPTFKISELTDICNIMTYEEVKEWYKAVEIDYRFK